jgi:hypothetical protein
VTETNALVVLLVVAVVAVSSVLIRDRLTVWLYRRREDRETADILAGHAGPGVPPLADVAPHDVLPEVDDLWREVAAGYLERMWSEPTRDGGR